MSYFVAGGIIALGIFLYRNKNKLIYESVKIYSDIENRGKVKETIYKYICNIDENNNLIQQEVETFDNIEDFEGKIIKLFYKNKLYLFINKKPKSLCKEYLDKIGCESTQILSCTMNLLTNSKSVLTEYDITDFINVLINCNETINLNKDSNLTLLKFIEKYYNIKLDKDFEYENFKIDWIIIDKDINIHKSENILLENKDDLKIINKNNI